jgi:hypothetical protein
LFKWNISFRKISSFSKKNMLSGRDDLRLAAAAQPENNDPTQAFRHAGSFAGRTRK